ncbi:MAG: MFS transporter [Thermodesulfobacteriota bacterium]
MVGWLSNTFKYDSGEGNGIMAAGTQVRASGTGQNNGEERAGRIFAAMKGFHYGWLIVAAGCLCIFACLGLGRFTLGMLLPAMGESLRLSYSQMGLIGTCNFCGYLVAVLGCSRLLAVVGARNLIALSLLLISLSAAMIGLARELATVTVLYTLTGIGSGVANVSMMGLVTAWFGSSLRGRAAGFVVIGSGFAILLSGQVIPLLNGLRPEGWRLSWFVLAGAVLAVAVICRLVLRNRPEDLGLAPVGENRAPAQTSPQAVFRPMNRRVILHCGLIYFLFGFTYVIYATFIVTVLVKEYGFSEEAAGGFWSWVGLLSLFSGPVFGTLSDRLGRKAGLMSVFAIQTLSYLLVGLKLQGAALFLSIGCFGLVAWSIPSIMIALVGDLVGAQNTVKAFGLITFIFGIGQILGPYVAGLLAESAGDFSGAFLLAAAMTALAIFISARLGGASPFQGQGAEAREP